MIDEKHELCKKITIELIDVLAKYPLTREDAAFIFISLSVNVAANLTSNDSDNAKELLEKFSKIAIENYDNAIVKPYK